MTKHLNLWLLGALILGACAIPDPGDINLSACTQVCSDENKECLALADPCFDDLEACFDSANACQDGCNGCVEAGTCLEESDCDRACADWANECTHLIKACVLAKELCLTQVTDCYHDCIADAEHTLKE